ncbi:MAG: glycosyltransferase family 4 protein, partial [Marinirhabdus sp.]|nr:glycosyltransferase family 4 protein [Marinirhabdus sp.]
MNILMCRSNPVAPDPRVEKEARALIEAGYSVQVIAWDRTAKLESQAYVNGIIIHRLAIKAKFGQGLGNLPALLRWQWGLTKWLVHNRNEYDTLQACDFDTILPGLLIKVFWRKPLVYDIFDFYADHLRRTPSWIKSIIRWLDFFAINHADAVILVDESRREQIKGTKPKRLDVIYNSPEDFPLKTRSFEASPQGGLRLTYVGLLQHERGLIEVLNTIKKHLDWTLEFAGFGGDEETITSLCKTMPNVNWHGRISYDKALELTRQADVLFATYDPAIPNHKYSSPNKLFEAMMLGKPIIVARETNMDMLVTKYDCGIIVEYGNEAELEEALL